MDSAWHLNAPQWTDFESSPQPPDDDYFEREHEALEPQPLVEKNLCEVLAANIMSETSQLKPKIHLLDVAGKNDSLINEIEIAKMTPVKVVSPKSRNRKNGIVKETTYDNVLSEAMASLQLSVKKKTRRSRSVRNISSQLATPTAADKSVVSTSLNLYGTVRSTPSNPIPMWIKKKRLSDDSDNVEKVILPANEQIEDKITQNNLVENDIQKQQGVEVDAEIIIVESADPIVIETDSNIQHLTVEEQLKVLQNSNMNKATEEPEINDIPSSEAMFHSAPKKRNSNIVQKSSYSNKGQQPRFSTCQLRRRSLTQYRRRSNKYISLAEAISKFQTGTPKRFRSMSSKNQKPGPLQKVRQSTVSATVPISPALRCKLRARPKTVLSQEEREQQEIQENRKHSVRENLARANSLKSLPQNPTSKTIGKKPAITQDLSNPTIAKISNLNLEKKVNRETRIKVTVPSVISTNEGIAVKDAEISSFGVPDITIAKATATKPMPFSFEIRNKELLKRKEKKIKELLTEEQKKIKTNFHARPVPAFKKPVLGASKDTTLPKSNTKLCPFSFEERDKNLMKKKENFIKTVLEEDKKARIFQAKPIPEFKPVLVRGTSKENISAGHKPPSRVPPHKTRISMLAVSKTGSRNCLLVKSNSFNQENENPSLNFSEPSSQQLKSKSNEDKSESQSKNIKVLVDRQFHLNTDKRARERKEFDERIKQKENELELLKKEAEAEKLKRNESERAEIRKMAEIKAKPMPIYKPPIVIRSDKPLTEPQSPGWAAKPKR